MPEEPSPSYTIKDVWGHNVEEEFRAIRKLIIKYPYVAMDTEFPGIVVRPLGEFKTTAEYQYQCLKLNVDFLKIIQLGLTLWIVKEKVHRVFVHISLTLILI